MSATLRFTPLPRLVGASISRSFGIAALGLALSAPTAWAHPGDLDPTFGDAGLVQTDFGRGSNQVNGLAIQPDGKLVAVGPSGSGHFAIARYNPDGTLDSGFGNGGKVISDLGGIFEAASGVAIQKDGKIVVVGTTAPEGYCCQAVVARFGADGSLDHGFGDGGKVYVTFSGGLQGFSDVALQTDGKIVAVGSGYDPFYSVATMVRFLPDGTLDPSFDGDGKATTNLEGYIGASAIAIQEDGKILSAGSGAGITIARYLADGTLDPAFGGNGVVVSDGSGTDLALQADGKIVACGLSGGVRFGLVRYLPDGSPDTGFGSNGRAEVQFTGDNIEFCEALAIQKDGRIVVVGSAFVAYDGRFAMARFDSKGQLDASFGSAGKVLTDFGKGGDGAQDVALDDLGRIVVAGGSGPCIPRCGFALARYEGGPSSVEVSIAVKSAAGRAAVNPASHGVLPVAILSTDDFDATLVDPQSVCFGNAEDPAQGDCTAAHDKGRLQDVNGDGRTDLVLQFDTEETGIRSSDTQACLTGTTFDGLAIHGCTDLRIRPGLKPSATPDAAGAAADASMNNTLELLSVNPSPNPGSVFGVRLRTDGQAGASLQVVDVTGRTLMSRNLDSLGPGVHEVSLSVDRPIGTSMYWVRLTREGRSFSKKIVLLR